MSGRHAHELAAAGEARWSAKSKDGLVQIKDEASGEVFQATAYTVEGDGVRFALPGDNGLRLVLASEPGFAELKKVFEKVLGAPSEAPAGGGTSTEKPVPGQKPA